MKLEEKVKKLEQIAKDLNREGIALDDNIASFNEGIAIARDCISELSKYKGKIELLNSELKELEADVD
jgi:exodeoxyribonuclease VII small subunit